MKCQVPLALPKSIQLSFLDVSVAAAVFVRTEETLLHIKFPPPIS